MADFAETGQLPIGSKEEKIMSRIVEYNDLCTTCNYASDCVRRKHHGKPVLYCEEFDDYQPSPERPLKGFADYSTGENLETSKLVTSRSMGLCAFCENQDTCENANKNGGVWHCEEYR